MTQAAPFFIVGHERSGTTLLSALLDRHSRVAIPFETHFFEMVCPIHKAHQQASPATMVEKFSNSKPAKRINLTPSNLLSRLNADQTSWADFFLIVLQAYADKHGKEFCGEKTPTHFKIAPQILELYPQSRMIWMVRDGRDVTLSVLRAPWYEHGILRVHAWEWRHSMELMWRYRRQYPDRIIEVKFENLVTQPELELIRICQFIGVDFESRQLDPAVKTDVVPYPPPEGHGRIHTAIDSSRVGGWEREFSTREKRLLESVMLPCLHQLGYQADDMATDSSRTEKFQNSVLNLLCQANLSWYRSITKRFFEKYALTRQKFEASKVS